MTEHAPDRIWAGIDIPKTIAGVLAAISAAVLGSFLGVAGTLAGAAVASIVGSVGTEVYTRSINKGAKKLQASFVTAPAAVGTPEVAAAADESPSEPEPPAPTQIRWKRVAVLAGAVFALAITSLTIFELVSRESVADAVGNKSSSTTTICSVLCGGQNTTSPAPATSGSATPTDTATTTEPTGSTQTPTTAPTTEPAAPAPTATTGPAPTGGPTPTGASTTGGPTGHPTGGAGNGGGQNLDGGNQ